jgi:hypothetical protein
MPPFPERAARRRGASQSYSQLNGLNRGAMT